VFDVIGEVGYSYLMLFAVSVKLFAVSV